MTWQAKYEPDAPNHESKIAQKRAQVGIRRELHDEYINTATPALKKTTEFSGDGVIASSATTAVVAAATTVSRAAEERNVLSRAIIAENNDNNNNEDADLDNIDPRLLDVDTLSNVPVDAMELASLDAQFFPVDDESLKFTPNEASMLDLLASEELFNISHDNTASKQPESAGEFISTFAKINVVSGWSFAQCWPHYEDQKFTFEESIRRHSTYGNSRDLSTSMIHACKKTPGCMYSSLRVDSLVNHERICTAEGVAEAMAQDKTLPTLLCSVKGCDRMF